MLDAWPDALKEAFGLDAYTTGPGFLNTELFSMMFPIVLIAVALGAAAAATAGEEERGTADLLLAAPCDAARAGRQGRRDDVAPLASSRRPSS